MTRSDLLTQIQQSIQLELKELDEFILKELHSDILLIQKITQHIITSGGKRLRPLVVILFAKLVSNKQEHSAIALAAMIEFVHTATLLHDDVIDHSLMRRGQDTSNALYGNQASVLVGDFLYSRAFQILTLQNNITIMQVLAKTTNAIAEGEVLQLMNCNDPTVDEQHYHQVIERKTAKLFEAACEIGLLSVHDDPHFRNAARSYGLHIGFAFQIIDDLLDYNADITLTGKNRGGDLSEGKLTLPLIYTLKHAEKSLKEKIVTSITKGSKEHLETIIAAMHHHDAFTYCLNQAKSHVLLAEKALDVFPPSEYRTALQQLLAFSLERTF